MPPFSFRQSAILPENPPPIVSIGLGGIVHDAHYPAYRFAGFSVAGGFDINAERAAMMKDKYAIPLLYDSLADAIAGAPENAVFDVAVPGIAISDILREIPRGRAVLIQKPMGDGLAQAREILGICRERKLVAAINFQLRFAPFIIAARDMIEQGLLGELCDMEFRVQCNTPWHLWQFLFPLASRRDHVSQHPLCRFSALILRHTQDGLCQDHGPPECAGSKRWCALDDHHGLW